MTGRVRILLVCTVLSIAILATGVAAQADAATTTPFVATFDLLPWRQIGLEAVWFTGDPPIYHVRGLLVEATPTGYPFDGCYVTIEFNWNINRNLGVYSEGRNWGLVTAVTPSGDGGWDITFTGSFVDGLGSGRLSGKGWGVYAGLHIRGTLQETSPSSEFVIVTGTIRMQGGP